MARTGRAGTFVTILQRALAVGAMVALAACSSGGGDSGDPTTTTETPATVTPSSTQTPYGDVIARQDGETLETWAEVKPTTTPIETRFGTVYVSDLEPSTDPEQVSRAGLAWMEAGCEGDLSSEVSAAMRREQNVSVATILCLPEMT